jgi:hypothetical protein
LDGSDGRRVSANNGKLVLVNSAGRLYYRDYAKQPIRTGIPHKPVDISRSFNI